MNSSSNSSTGTLNVAGNFAHTGGTINESASGSSSIIFNGSSVIQTYTSGGTVNNAINFIIQSGAVVDFGTSVLAGAGSAFNLNPGAGIITANTNGLQAAGTNSGSIQTASRTYSSRC